MNDELSDNPYETQSLSSHEGISVEPDTDSTGTRSEAVSKPTRITLQQDMADVRGELGAIRKLIEERLSYDAGKERAFERLYAELDDLKRKKAFEDTKPLYIDLILLYDRMDVARKEADGDFHAVLQSLQEELEEILQRRGIEVAMTDSDVFNPTTQKVVSVEGVTASSLNGKVLRILRVGFICGGFVLRPQEVVIGRSQPLPEESGTGQKKEDR